MLPLFIINLLLYFTPLTFEIAYTKDIHKHKLSCRVSILSIINLYQLELPDLQANLNIWEQELLSFKTKTQNSLDGPEKQDIEVRNPLKLLKDVWPILVKIYPYLLKIYKPLDVITKKFFATIKCQELTWSTEIGLHDAAVTALLSGALWNIKYNIKRNLLNNVEASQTRINFRTDPLFNKSCFNVNFRCIFMVRIGNIIITNLKVGTLLIRSLLTKGGVHAERPSN